MCKKDNQGLLGARDERETKEGEKVRRKNGRNPYVPYQAGMNTK